MPLAVGDGVDSTRRGNSNDTWRSPIRKHSSSIAEMFKVGDKFKKAVKLMTCKNINMRIQSIDFLRILHSNMIVTSKIISEREMKMISEYTTGYAMNYDIDEQISNVFSR